MEILTGVERRRRWRVDEKLRILAELERPGACFAAVARRHDVSRGLLWNWRRQMRNGTLGPETDVRFLRVPVMPDAAPVGVPPAVEQPASRKPRSAADATIEIGLPDGTTVRVGRDVGAAALRRVLGVLRG